MHRAHCSHSTAELRRWCWSYHFLDWPSYWHRFQSKWLLRYGFSICDNLLTQLSNGDFRLFYDFQSSLTGSRETTVLLIVCDLFHRRLITKMDPLRRWRSVANYHQLEFDRCHSIHLIRTSLISTRYRNFHLLWPCGTFPGAIRE